MNGTFKLVKGQTITYVRPDGLFATQDVDPKAGITLNGATVKLSDLRDGDLISMSGQPATSVTAMR